jgi:uncharacterized protein (DUF3820 family)
MVYDLDTPLAFGKYKGRTVEDVLQCDPAYLLWAMENVDQFEVDDDAINRDARR